jgi:hypothetical protein
MIEPIYPKLYSDNSNKLIYFHAPKCASRTIIGWYSIINYPTIFKDNLDWFDPYKLGDYPDIYKLVNRPNFPDVLNSPRFCVIRDPIERFISAFTDRVLRYKMGEYHEIKTVDNFINNFDYYNDKYQVLAHHVRPQYLFYGEDLSNYDYVFKFSEIYKIKELLEDTYSIYLPDLHLQQCKNIEKPKLSKEQINFLIEFYKKDYEFFEQYLS